MRSSCKHQDEAVLHKYSWTENQLRNKKEIQANKQKQRKKPTPISLYSLAGISCSWGLECKQYDCLLFKQQQGFQLNGFHGQLINLFLSCMVTSLRANGSRNFPLSKSPVAYLEVYTCLLCLSTVEVGKKLIFNLSELQSYQNEQCFHSVIMNVWISFLENGCSVVFKYHLVNYV